MASGVVSSPGPMQLVTLASIEEAAAALPESVRSSPVVRWRGKTWLKLESLQPTGSFKIRGAVTKLKRLPPEGRTRGVVAYSSGNHGIAVARAARLCGTKATIVVPTDAPGPKAGAIALEGATIVPCPPVSPIAAWPPVAPSSTVPAPPPAPDVIRGPSSAPCAITGPDHGAFPAPGRPTPR